jgi:hypothetical protein
MREEAGGIYILDHCADAYVEYGHARHHYAIFLYSSRYISRHYCIAVGLCGCRIVAGEGE